MPCNANGEGALTDRIREDGELCPFGCAALLPLGRWIASILPLSRHVNAPPGGEIPDDEWLALTRSGFEMTWADPVADLITKLHLQQLTSYGRAHARQALATEMAQAIQAKIGHYGLDSTIFEQIDRITVTRAHDGFLPFATAELHLFSAF
jgi:hypothetical protein